jgi:hypothetical protein
MANLYNVMFRTNRLAGELMKALKLEQLQCGRFRDCYLQLNGDELEIHVLTRNGGGNRVDYQAVTTRLQQWPGYLRDFDDAFDSTYATYVFAVPGGMLESLRARVQQKPGLLPPPVGVRFKEFMQRMNANPRDPDVLRVQEIIRPTIERLAVSTSRVQGLIDGDEPLDLDAN